MEFSLCFSSDVFYQELWSWIWRTAISSCLLIADYWYLLFYLVKLIIAVINKYAERCSFKLHQISNLILQRRENYFFISVLLLFQHTFYWPKVGSSYLSKLLVNETLSHSKRWKTKNYNSWYFIMKINTL